MAKIAHLSLSSLAGDTIITAMFKTGFQSWSHPYEITGGLPQDAKLVDAEWDKEMQVLRFFFESEEFPDVDDPRQQSGLTIMATHHASK